MNVAYWILAGPLALFYLYSGGIKTVQDRARLRPMMAWVDAMPMPAVRTIGAIEVCGAIGLVLPPLTGTAPWLALAAAIGFEALQTAAIGVHLSRGEREIALNLTLLAVGAMVIWTATTWL
ncbi:DoxX family protein [Streptomyces sp. NPDC048416]|uniref:DoxX family protein n=1 Tax=Streptomyces sp. NPDC048416 TaxID=3365546 RepID=UPI00371A623B